MSNSSEKLFTFLRDIFYKRQNAELDLGELDDDFLQLGQGLNYFSKCISEYNEYTSALAKGDLDVPTPPPENELAAPLKSLHASLRHLTWQTKQVAKGDYKQRVDFMGEFADAFNTMVDQLSERQQKLENEIEVSQRHAQAMEQSNMLLRKLMHYFPEQVFVVSTDDYEVLLSNDSAQREIDRDPEYIKKLMQMVPEHCSFTDSNSFELQYTRSFMEHYLSINMYQIEWQEKNAVALVINDVSVEKRQLKMLEDYAYRDSLTSVYNRFFGMHTLEEWLHTKKQFALVFVDLDNLKYINDQFGHSDGDEYIVRVARHLLAYSEDAIVCRIGGDEYMVLAPHSNSTDANSRMKAIQSVIQNDGQTQGKDYYYSISVGIVAVDSESSMSSREILSIADDRMYKQKRAKKRRGVFC